MMDGGDVNTNNRGVARYSGKNLGKIQLPEAQIGKGVLRYHKLNKVIRILCLFVTLF